MFLLKRIKNNIYEYNATSKTMIIILTNVLLYIYIYFKMCLNLMCMLYINDNATLDYIRVHDMVAIRVAFRTSE